MSDAHPIRSTHRAGRYIFVWDQGVVFSTDEVPTQRDLAYAKVGMLTIVNVDAGRYYSHQPDHRPGLQEKRRWRRMPHAVLRNGEHVLADE
ncbi:hypothetical protein [Opitutus terrae]|uniref:Uncharacterized protein n=1 Tax=Opitutus terrae (strain DSM 11246 / JCM 15787 / PB90-1) TaxID=452637 RepID=B1ZQG2_OPITP|nr:hypothetical protein [Opitutus terrae]ACB73641.1 hypothetical protein Oter_0351 [Opitutus terrae PB90-1]